MNMAHNVLIVEDNIIIAIDMKERLESHGYDVPAIAQTGESAVALAKRIRPDVILMDIGLGPGMNGIQAAQEIRKQERTPVIFVTGNSHLLGSEDKYLDKPFDEQELVQLIESEIRR